MNNFREALADFLLGFTIGWAAVTCVILLVLATR